MKFMRIAFTVLAALLLAGCASNSIRIVDKPLAPNEIAGIDVGVAADGISGQEITVSVVRTRHPHTGAEIVEARPFNNGNTGGRITETFVGAVVPSIVNAAAGIAIADRSGCKSENCGTQIAIQGARSISQSAADALAQAEGTGTASIAPPCITCTLLD